MVQLVVKDVRVSSREVYVNSWDMHAGVPKTVL